MRVAVIGSGYVGLVSGVCLAELGHDVVCIDVDPARVDDLNAGRPPIHEADLPDLLTRTVASGRFRASGDLAGAVAEAGVVLVCVGTPSREDGSIDLSAVERASGEVGAALAGSGPDRGHGRVAVVVKSTVVPGSTDEVVGPAIERTSGLAAGRDFGLGVNPEFLTEGTAVDDFRRPDRLVLGGDAIALDGLRELYAAFGDVPRVETNARTAEMIKYASNAMLATAISFTNEIANLGAAIGGIDTVEVMRGVHLSRYLTPDGVRAPLASFYEAGCGYGGSCLPKDVAALTARGASVGAGTDMLSAVAAVNAGQPERLVDLVRGALGELAGRRVAVLGLAFKPDTDDTRFSPAFPVLRALLADGAVVIAHDPVVGPEAVAGLGPVRHTHDLRDAIAGVDAIVLVTRWPLYSSEVPKLVGDDDRPPVVIDGRRVIPPDSVPVYRGIGR